MYNFPIGVIIDSFRCDLKEAVVKAAKLGANGIQVYASRGEMAPENLSKEKRKEFLKHVKDNGLVISALCGDLGGGGFTVPENNLWKVEKSKEILELAKELETDIRKHASHLLSTQTSLMLILQLKQVPKHQLFSRHSLTLSAQRA